MRKTVLLNEPETWNTDDLFKISNEKIHLYAKGVLEIQVLII